MTETKQLQDLYQDALKLHEQGKFSQAAACYQKILRHFPDADLVRYNLGLALYEQQQFSEAAAAFLHAAKINPDDPDYWFNAGLSLKQAGQYQEALTAYEKARLLRPEDADTLYNTGCCLQSAGDRVGAMAAYEQALALVPDHASALSNLAYCTHCAGDYERASVLYQRLLVLHPDHVAARYMLDALKGKNTTSPPPEYVAGLFDGYSENFDQDLLNNLSYRVPDLLHRLLLDRIGTGGKNMLVVDLGCGTGLSGQAVSPWAARLLGVDLSAKMVAEADKKGCYDQLTVGDVVDFLNDLNEPVDLLLAADVLTYLGDLEPLFRAASTRVRPGGLFCFSVEHEDQSGWQLRPTGRYGHHPDYIRSLADKYGWQVRSFLETEIRKERDCWIVGDLYLLQYRSSD
jgi:predicted TPR repeat methyltransferase